MTMIPSRLCSAAGKSREDVPTIVRVIGKGGEGSSGRRQKGRLLVVCLLRLLMAVLRRVRNWRVCTRSLYTPRSSFSLFLPFRRFFFLLVPPLLCSPFVLVAPSFFTGRQCLVPFSVVATFVPPASYVFSSSLTRCVASCRLVLYRLLLLPFPSVYAVVYFVNTRPRFEKETRSLVSLKPLSVAAPPMIFRRLAV